MCLKPDRLEAIISLSLLCWEQKSLFPLGLLLGRIRKKREKERKIAPSNIMPLFPRMAVWQVAGNQVLCDG